MSAEIIQFRPRPVNEHNEMILARIAGVAAQNFDGFDPTNPNVDTSPCEMNPDPA